MEHLDCRFNYELFEILKKLKKNRAKGLEDLKHNIHTLPIIENIELIFPILIEEINLENVIAFEIYKEIANEIKMYKSEYIKDKNQYKDINHRVINNLKMIKELEISFIMSFISSSNISIQVISKSILRLIDIDYMRDDLIKILNRVEIPLTILKVIYFLLKRDEILKKKNNYCDIIKVFKCKEHEFNFDNKKELSLILYIAEILGIEIDTSRIQCRELMDIKYSYILKKYKHKESERKEEDNEEMVNNGENDLKIEELRHLSINLFIEAIELYSSRHSVEEIVVTKKDHFLFLIDKIKDKIKLAIDYINMKESEVFNIFKNIRKFKDEELRIFTKNDDKTYSRGRIITEINLNSTADMLNRFLIYNFTEEEKKILLCDLAVEEKIIRAYILKYKISENIEYDLLFEFTDELLFLKDKKWIKKAFKSCHDRYNNLSEQDKTDKDITKLALKVFYVYPSLFSEKYFYSFLHKIYMFKDNFNNKHIKILIDNRMNAYLINLEEDELLEIYNASSIRLKLHISYILYRKNKEYKSKLEELEAIEMFKPNKNIFYNYILNKYVDYEFLKNFNFRENILSFYSSLSRVKIYNCNFYYDKFYYLNKEFYNDIKELPFNRKTHRALKVMTNLLKNIFKDIKTTGEKNTKKNIYFLINLIKVIRNKKENNKAVHLNRNIIENIQLLGENSKYAYKLLLEYRLLKKKYKNEIKETIKELLSYQLLIEEKNIEDITDLDSNIIELIKEYILLSGGYKREECLSTDNLRLKAYQIIYYKEIDINTSYLNDEYLKIYLDNKKELDFKNKIEIIKNDNFYMRKYSEDQENILYLYKERENIFNMLIKSISLEIKYIFINNYSLLKNNLNDELFFIMMESFKEVVPLGLWYKIFLVTIKSLRNISLVIYTEKMVIKYLDKDKEMNEETDSLNLDLCSEIDSISLTDYKFPSMKFINIRDLPLFYFCFPNAYKILIKKKELIDFSELIVEECENKVCGVSSALSKSGEGYVLNIKYGESDDIMNNKSLDGDFIEESIIIDKYMRVRPYFKNIKVGKRNRDLFLLRLNNLLSGSNKIMEVVSFYKINMDNKLMDKTECFICYFMVEYTEKKLVEKKCGNCNNWFHSKCLNKWLRKSRNSNCPICRQEFFKMK